MSRCVLCTVSLVLGSLSPPPAPPFLKPLLARSFQKLKHSILQESPRNFWGNVENVDYVLGDRLVLMLGCPSIVSFRKQSDDITTF